MKEDVRLPVGHVSDTAYMVALCRALESERDDARFNDPYAAMLGAPKADELMKAVPFLKEGQWLLTVRTCLLDEHIRKLVAAGADTVVNLAAGLDTRPYRLTLPRGLRWIEADLPGITEYKSVKLGDQVPVCRLERIAIDLSDRDARGNFFRYFDGESKKAVVITEGLLPYLDESVVGELATDLLSVACVDSWLMDITTSGFIAWMREKLTTTPTTSGSVRLTFAPETGARYFDAFGWKVKAFDSFVDGAERFDRKPPESLASPHLAQAVNDSGIALLEKLKVS